MEISVNIKQSQKCFCHSAKLAGVSWGTNSHYILSNISTKASFHAIFTG